jgi:hypothetical protein
MELDPKPTAALCLPESEISALLQGRMLAMLSATFIKPQRMLALQPIPDRLNPRSHDAPYRFTDLAHESIAPAIRAIVVCQECQIIDDLADVDAIAALTIWSKDFLTRLIATKGHIFLAGVRVFRLQTPHPLEHDFEDLTKIGKYVPAPRPFCGGNPEPVLPEAVFKRRLQQLRDRQPPEHSELEALQSALADLVPTLPAATQLDNTIQAFLGWQVPGRSSRLSPWMSKIAKLGASSEGNEFERIVRKAMISLGFSNTNHNPKASLDPEGVGGAGGLDFVCEAPYLVIGECKSSSRDTLRDSVFSQLIHLGNKHLNPEEYERAIKLVISVGRPSSHARKTALGNRMNLIKPATLERLVKLNALYPGALNLWELEDCLKNPPYAQDADDQINAFVDEKIEQLKIRAFVIDCFKRLAVSGNTKSVGAEQVHAVYVTSQPPKLLEMTELHEVAVELSSPLTGYLGREKGRDWRGDRFFWLRDLAIEKI